MDYGPQRGKPVLVLHSMIFPDITADDLEFAHTNNLRFIWPIRPGILQSPSIPQSVQDYCTKTVEGMELVWEHFCGEPVSIVAMVSSAWHATAFAEKHPGKVADISFAATCFSAGKYENNLVYFGSSVAELCSRNTWLMTKTVDYLRSSVDDINTFRKTINRIFQNSAPDTDVLFREFDAPYYGQRIKTALVNSPESVKHDYFNQVHFRWSRITKLTMPVKFIHGEKDSIHKLTDVKRLLRGFSDNPQYIKLHTLPNSGHILQYEHLSSLFHLALSLNESQPKNKTRKQPTTAQKQFQCGN